MRAYELIIAISLILILIPVYGEVRGLDETSNDLDDPGTRVEKMLLSSHEGEVLIGPGDGHIIEIDASSMNTAPSPSEILDPAADKAVEEAPDWLKIDLMHKFRILSSAEQNEFGSLINEAPEERLKDEISFCIAHSTPETLRDDNFFPRILTHNAELIYEMDEYLDYVEIIEKEDYTTVSYRQEDGTFVEADRELYYWFIVHPKLGDELPTYVDPEYDYTSEPPFDRNKGTAPPVGKYWREWFLEYNKPDQPLLKDSLQGKNTTLDAIKAINGWISNSMQFTSDQERPVQPVRIYMKGIGRCGEYQDMRSAAARAALIPVVATSNSAEDHVWNEFWDLEWYHWDGTINNPRMYENGWGKTISSVWNARGDGYTWPVTSRYSDVCTLEISVIDSMWNPVDGATVEILTENFYQPEVKTTTIRGTTDHTGTLVLEVGESRNYWGRTSTSDLGSDPPGPMPPKEIVLGSVVGETYEVLFQLPMQADELVDIPQELPYGNENSLVLDIEFEVDGNILRGSSPVPSGRFDLANISGDIDFFITNQVGLAAYGAGAPINSYNMLRRADHGSVLMNISMDSQWAVVFSNGFSQWTSKIVSYNISISGLYGIEIESPAKGEDFPYLYSKMVEGVYLCPEDDHTLEIRIDEEGEWISLPTNIITYRGNQTLRYFQYEWRIKGIDLGTHSIWLRLISGSGQGLTVVRYVDIIDVTPPTISYDQSEPEAREGEELYLSGSVADDIEVGSIWYSFREGLSGPDIDIDDDGRSWEVYIPTSTFVLGDNEIFLNADDTSGNIQTKSILFKLHDNEPPEIRIDSPDDGSLIKKGDIITVKGRTYHSRDIETLYVSIAGSRDIDMTGSLLPDGTFSKEISTNIRSLEDGDVRITVRALDEGGNLGEDDVIVKMDATPPMFVLGDLADGIIHGVETDLDLSFDIIEDIGPLEVSLSINGGDKEDMTRYLDEELFRARIDSDEELVPGWNELEFTASDLSGWITEETIDCFIDVSAPTIKEIDVARYVILGDELDLGLELIDDDMVQRLEISGNGIFETSEMPGQFFDIGLDTSSSRKGLWDIDLICTDRAGHIHESSVEVNFIREDTDSDRDGVPDLWEYQNGMDPLKFDSDDDPDGDGFTNLEEYLGDGGTSTDPRSSSSYPSRDLDSGTGGAWILFLGVGLILIGLVIYLVVSRIR